MDKEILVVDDDAMNLRLAELFLTKAGYQVIKAESGQACLNILDHRPVDLILLDVEMPQLNGIQTLQKIRGENLAQGVPVCFLSASHSPETELAEKQLGVSAFILKPFLPTALIETVEAALSQGGAL